MRNGLFAIVLGLASITAAHASIDVVESVPLETTLAVPGVQDTQAAWLELINAAQNTIDLEEFYLQNGDSLQPVLDALKSAAGRGVKIRLLLDKGFYTSQPADPNAFAASTPNVQMKTIDFSSLGGIMHAKYFVVDNKKAYVGSANFDWLALSHIHEIGLKLDGAAMADGLTSIFNMDWANGVTAGSSSSSMVAPRRALDSLTSSVASTVDTFLQIFASPIGHVPAGTSTTLDAIVTMMNEATSTIKIQMYEYATTYYGSSQRFLDLDNAIRAAAARGVKVQFIVDQTSLKAGKAALKALNGIANISVKVITIPQWSGGHLDYARLIHSKYMITDDKKVWIGSENWQGGYFTNTRNVGMITDDAPALTKMTQIFSQVWNSAYGTNP